MGFARRHASDLRREARQLRCIGLNSLATEREHQAEVFERIADDVEMENPSSVGST